MTSQLIGSGLSDHPSSSVGTKVVCCRLHEHSIAGSRTAQLPGFCLPASRVATYAKQVTPFGGGVWALALLQRSRWHILTVPADRVGKREMQNGERERERENVKWKERQWERGMQNGKREENSHRKREKGNCDREEGNGKRENGGGEGNRKREGNGNRKREKKYWAT